MEICPGEKSTVFLDMYIYVYIFKFEQLLPVYPAMEWKVVCLVLVCDRCLSFTVSDNTLNSSLIGHRFIITDRKTSQSPSRLSQ